MGSCPFFPFRVSLGARVEVDRVAIVPQGRALRKLRHIRADGEIGRIDAVEFIGIRVDMNELAIMLDKRRHGIAVGRRFAEPCPHGDNQIGVFDALDQLGIGAVSEIARVNAAGGRDCVLPAERGGNGDAQPFGE